MTDQHAEKVWLVQAGWWDGKNNLFPLDFGEKRAEHFGLVPVYALTDPGHNDGSEGA